jgi:hypothetical protein
MMCACCCAISLVSSPTPPMASASNCTSTTNTYNYVFTDYSSINEPTLTQNKQCLIPFVYNNFKYNYCAYKDGKFQCKIDEILVLIHTGIHKFSLIDVPRITIILIRLFRDRTDVNSEI